jgi:hypothetical protein
MTQAASSYARIEGDKYFTPRKPIEDLLSVETFVGTVFDPGAGAGHILDVLAIYGIPCHGMDIAPDVSWIAQGDFLLRTDPLDNVLANPPYGVGSRVAVQFIEHALKLTKPTGGKVAMLLKVGFDSAKGRRHLFADHPAFAVEYRLLTRIRWANLEQSAAGPTENHSWFVWDWRKRPGPAVKGYLPTKEATDAH